ncbi:hypothetical protein [Capybara microvirus Cap1_SP_217]|nr:hypothetical protein [Capybara microvirus Cap1_SP_217]
MKLKTQKATYFSCDGEFNDEASMSQPNLAYSIKDLLERAKRGIAPPDFTADYDGYTSPLTGDTGLDMDADFDPTNRIGIDFDELAEISADGRKQMEERRAEYLKRLEEQARAAAAPPADSPAEPPAAE